MKQHLSNSSLVYILPILFVTFILSSISIRKIHKDELNRIKIALEEKTLLIEKFEEKNDKPGGFVLLNKDVDSVTFKNFEGEIIWYQSYNIKNSNENSSNIDFHPIEHEPIIENKALKVPSNAHAFLRRGTIKNNEENYSVVYDTK
jgi:hypothetical protein